MKNSDWKKNADLPLKGETMDLLKSKIMEVEINIEDSRVFAS